ncbi:MAG TPA: Ig-like domain-containing protein [Kofleriaceae bacterium]|nr:Ig-like domain-containing protein [Kofleriaceae bacterium]
MAACVTAEDDFGDGLPLNEPTVVATSPALDTYDTLDGRVPAAPPTWTDHRPEPQPDVITTLEDAEVKVRIDAILANDSDPDGGRVVFMGLGAQGHGTATVVDRYVVFEPAPDFNGKAWFDYIISDGRMQATGRVEVDVTAVNDPPVAFANLVNTRTDEPIQFRLDMMDPDGDSLIVDILAPPEHGSLTPNDSDDDKLTYAPAGDWSGTDTLVYRVGDGTAWSDPVTVDLVVSP